MTYNDKKFEFKSNIKEIIGKNIRKYRIETDYGQRGFSIETLYRISVVLEKDMSSFFEETLRK